MGSIFKFYFAYGPRSLIHTEPCLIRRPTPHRASTIPPTSTTPAASASSCTSRGGGRTGSFARRSQVLINLLHRGACGCEANTGDGAGILIQMPDRFLRRKRGALGIALPPPSAVRRGPGVPPARRRRPRAPIAAICSSRSSTRKGRRSSAGATCPTDDTPGRPERRRGRAGVPADLHRPGSDGCRPGVTDARAPFERKLYVIRKRDRARRRRARRCRSARCFYIVSLSSQHADLQGHAHGRIRSRRCSPIWRPGRRVGAGARAPAVQHQHVPVLAAGASVPLRRAQRRDQHAARQHQLDEGARGAVRVGAVRRRPAEDPADHPRGRQRHGDVRQRARVPRHGRAIAAARDSDDDSGAVGRPREHERRARRRSTSTTRRSWSPGTARRPSRSPTAR